MLQSIPAGFSRPVFESQSTFRAILSAMSRPGRPVVLPVLAQGPVGWSNSMAALVLTLCDMDTPLWLDPASSSPEALRFLRFHCGSPLVDEPARAAFAVVSDPLAMPNLTDFALGSAEYPEKSATVLLAAPVCASNEAGFRLRGPGVEGCMDMPRSWLPAGFVRAWRGNGQLFPRGVDTILVGSDRIVGLPRTLKVEEATCM
jgi:alpha-D-ribose 1-methylphosphonate 5-triphosphate synthase subunit PhnH